MNTRLDPAPQRQLLDPAAFEAAGRHFREWLDRLLHRAEPEVDTSIAWESGEPENEARPPAH